MSTYTSIHNVTKIKSSAQLLAGCGTLKLFVYGKDGEQLELTLFANKHEFPKLHTMVGLINDVQFGWTALDRSEAA